MHGSSLSSAGTSNFKGHLRKHFLDNVGVVPGPGEYDPAEVPGGPKEIKKNLAFGVKTKRFTADDTLAPGPG